MHGNASSTVTRDIRFHGRLRGPLIITPVVKRLIVVLSLFVLTT